MTAYYSPFPQPTDGVARSKGVAHDFDSTISPSTGAPRRSDVALDRGLPGACSRSLEPGPRMPSRCGGRARDAIRVDISNTGESRALCARGCIGNRNSLWPDGRPGVNLGDGVTLPTEIFGARGSDHIRGGGGADTIHGGRGHDTIQGRAGNDNLEGNEGRDIIRGHNGNDLVDGGNGLDAIRGDLGTDTLLNGFDFDNQLIGTFNSPARRDWGTQLRHRRSRETVVRDRCEGSPGKRDGARVRRRRRRRCDHDRQPGKRNLIRTYDFDSNGDDLPDFPVKCRQSGTPVRSCKFAWANRHGRSRDDPRGEIGLRPTSTHSINPGPGRLPGPDCFSRGGSGLS